MISRSMAEFLSLMREKEIPGEDLSADQNTLLDEARSAGYVWQGNTRDMRMSLSLTEKGRTALRLFDEEAKDHADQERQRKKELIRGRILHGFVEVVKILFGALVGYIFADPAAFWRQVCSLFGM